MVWKDGFLNVKKQQQQQQQQKTNKLRPVNLASFMRASTRYGNIFIGMLHVGSYFPSEQQKKVGSRS